MFICYNTTEYFTNYQVFINNFGDFILNPEFERLEHIATEYFDGFSGLGKKMQKKSTSFYFYKKSQFGNKFLKDLEDIGINPEYIRRGQTPMFLNTFNLDRKAKEKYLMLGNKTTNEPETQYDTPRNRLLSNEETTEILQYLSSMPLYKEIAYANTGTILADLSQFKIGDVIEKTTMIVGDPKNFGAVEVSGNSMVEFHIMQGSRVIFNKALQPKNGNIVVVIINGNLMVKQLIIKNGEFEFHSGDGGATKPIVGCPDDICQIIGVVTDMSYKFI